MPNHRKFRPRTKSFARIRNPLASSFWVLNCLNTFAPFSTNNASHTIRNNRVAVQCSLDVHIAAEACVRVCVTCMRPFISLDP